MAGEMKVSVSLLLEFPGGDKAVTAAREGELYDEDKEKHPESTNARCVEMTGIIGPDGKELPWVAYVKKVIIYSNEPDSLKLGGGEVVEVGLTNEIPDTWTKTKQVLVAKAIPPFTVEGLRKAGLI